MEVRPLTGDACVEALIRAGFRIRSRGNGIALLARGSSIVMVPDVGVIGDGMLQAILRSAGITMLELEAQLTHLPTRSGFFRKQRAPADEERATQVSAKTLAPPPNNVRRG